ncbi:EAL domain-containing protein [Stenotrophomonas sp.]|uniref:EAL domain-containing protein n=1 Tax=Stenotrophomonas sp. TaxID=69392 RepID=UPI0028A94DB1|nr:EAL domain-containing protein [Stenotrophomonas sp.]
MDRGLIATLLRHPLSAALVLLDPEGQPLAANGQARELGLPATLSRYSAQLAGSRVAAAEQDLVACLLPAGCNCMEGALSALRAPDGNALGYLYTSAASDAQRSERWMQAMQAAGHRLWDWDLGADHLVVTRPDQAPVDMLPALGLLDDVHPDDQAQLREAILLHLQDAEVPFTCQFRVRQPDGRWRWVMNRGKVVARGGDGRPQRMIGTSTDIQQQKQLEDELRAQQALLRRAQRVAGMGSWAWDAHSGQLEWSAELVTAIGWEQPALPRGRQWMRQLGGETRQQLFAHWRRLLDDGQPGSFDLTWGRDPLYQQHLRIWLEVERDGAGQLQRVLGQVQNISGQRRTDALIRWRTELLNRVSALGRIGGCEIEVETRLMQWTEECYRIHGLRKAPVTLDQALALYTQDSRDSFEAALTRIAAGGLPEQLDLCFYRPSGQRIWVQVLVELDRRDGLPERYVVLFRDTTREREADERLELLAHYDLLTGLPNRMLLREQAGEAMIEASERGAILAMLFIDLDGFKSINDTFGHATGDMLLKAAAARLHQNLRNADLFARFNGDEFIVILRNLAEPDDAGHVARKLIASLAEPLYRDDVTLKVGASVGIALQDETRNDFDSLLRAADAAMHAAKEAGRNTYQYYSQDALARTQRRLDIEHALHGAVDRDEFSLVYQPLVDAREGQPPSIEALLRWNSAKLGICPPTEFIPIAEKCGEIVRIGDWVLEEVCRQATVWEQAGLQFERVAVNVSAIQLRERGFAERVVAICKQYGWPPHRLELELTESALIRDTDTLRQCFDIFDQHGIPLAVDDFGTGFSNLHYLNRFPVQRLKIDRSFVQGMLHDAGTAEVTQAIVHLGHALGMRVVAEGVETTAEAAMLQRQGCDALQGYLFARPLRPREMVQWLKQDHSQAATDLPQLQAPEYAHASL